MSGIARTTAAKSIGAVLHVERDGVEGLARQERRDPSGSGMPHQAVMTGDLPLQALAERGDRRHGIPAFRRVAVPGGCGAYRPALTSSIACSMSSTMRGGSRLP